jgi:MoaA/NifB/PqqE/SkfB family radical SAM enzyme
MSPSRGNPPPPADSPKANAADQSMHPGELLEFCGGCSPGAVDDACRGSFERLGAHKVHWESWSRCNLGCGFCYRSEGVPLGPDDGLRLVSAVATAGASTIVFAGGDPALRSDLGDLVAAAHSVGLQIEVHTNAQFSPEHIRRTLSGVDCVGLSLDAPTAALHDTLRHTRGNFAKVRSLLRFLEDAGIPVIVRTVVIAPNYLVVPDIGELLLGARNVLAWYLLEFSPVGLGFRTRREHELPRERFDEVAAEASRRYGADLEVHARRLEDNSGGYVRVTPDGLAYGTGGAAVDGIYSKAGSVLQDHLSDLAAGIGFQRERHEPRYAMVERMRLQTLANLTARAEGFPSPSFHVQLPQK